MIEYLNFMIIFMAHKIQEDYFNSTEYRLYIINHKHR